MIKATLGGKEYNIKNSWEELNLKEYKQLLKIMKDETIENNVDQIVNLLSGIPIDLLNKIKWEEYKLLQNELDFLQEFKIDTDTITHIFTIDGIEYGLLDFSNMLKGEFVDLFELKKDINKNITEFLSVIYRPIKEYKYVEKSLFKRKKKYFEKKFKKQEYKGEKLTYIIEDYNLESYKKRIELFENAVTLGMTYSAVVFFWNIIIRFQKDTKYFSELMKEISIETKKETE